jgi:hypothetical protein
MDTSKKLSSEKRREVMIAGLAGVSAIFTGTGGTAWAQRIESKGKIDQKLTEPVASMIPGIAKVRVREQTYQPGASSKAKMQDAMICECTQGTLEITQDNDKPFVAKTGHMWTCNVGTIEITANKGSTPAIMRVIDLMKA